MKKIYLPASALLFSALLFSCGTNPAVLEAEKINKAYNDSINAADSIAKNAPPVPINFSQVLDKTYNGKKVSVEGYLSLPSTSYHTDANEQLNFIERESEFSAPFNFILDVNVGTGNNTMQKLPDKYLDADVNVKGNKGEKIGIGDRVRITGKLDVNGDYVSLNVEVIEKIDPVVIDYSTLGATQITTKADASMNNRMVYAEGKIEIPTMTMSGDYTFLYLNVAPGNQIDIDVAYGDGPAKLGTLPENYSESDFKIPDPKNNPVNIKKKVRVYGLWKDDRIKVECIENI